MTQIKWDELTEKDKIGLLIEHVLKWQRVVSLHSERTAWPVACYYSDERHPKWIVQDRQWEPFKVFNPLCNMDDAWLVVERITEPPQSREEASMQASTRFMLWWQGSDIWSMRRAEAASAICVAALRAAGVEVVQ